MVDFNPTHEILEDVDVLYQVPANPKAILYLVHGRNGSPFGYWPPNPSVPKCSGTPESKVVVKQALEKGFAVIASKSITSEWETWPPSSPDVQKVVKILKSWRAEHELETLPLTAWGISCGGDFVSTLALEVEMFSLVIMISHGHPEAIKAAVAGQYPPTLWVPMIKDEECFVQVKRNVDILMGKGISSAFVEAPPHLVTPHFLAENIDELTDDQATKLHSLFVENGIVAEDNSLTKLLLDHEVEPFLRLAGILPLLNADQQRGDLEMAESKEGESGGPSPAGSRSSGGFAGPPGGRPIFGRISAGGRGMTLGGRGQGMSAGRGSPNIGGGKIPSCPLASSISNQLRVAQGIHTLTSRHNPQVFDWIEGKTWPTVQT